MRRVRKTIGDRRHRVNRVLERASFHTAVVTGILTPAAGAFLSGPAASLWATVFAVSAATWMTCAGQQLLDRIRAVTNITATS